jgi:DNA relaxase NicK
MAIRALYDSATNFSRIDYQSTVRMSRQTPNFAEQLERCAKAFKRRHNSKFEIELRRNDARGKTLYLGRRASERFIRVYDKAAESRLPDYELCWRAEVQYAGALANRRASQYTFGRSDPVLCHSVVLFELARRGISWMRLPERLCFADEAQFKRKSTTNARRLEWLRTQVRPTVEKLIDAGALEEVRSVLGIPDPV